MSATLEELTKRVESLEQEVVLLKTQTNGLVGTPAHDSQEPDLFRLSRLNQPALSAAVDRYFREAGITCEPIPAEELQARIARELEKKGIRPEDNVFSREIIAMREE